MSAYISICTDLTALAADFPELFDAESGSQVRGNLKGWSGDYTLQNGNRSMKVLTDLTGLDELAEKSYITVATPEQIFGYRRQVVLVDESGDEPVSTPQFAPPTLVTPPSYYEQVLSHYVDGDPIYVVERIETPTTHTVTDEEGNTTEVAGRPIVVYVTTDVIVGYKQVPVYVDGDQITPEPYYVPNPIMETIPADATLRALYDEIYPRTPITDDEGNTHTPSLMFAVPGGYDTSHLVLE